MNARLQVVDGPRSVEAYLKESANDLSVVIDTRLTDELQRSKHGSAGSSVVGRIVRDEHIQVFMGGKKVVDMVR